MYEKYKCSLCHNTFDINPNSYYFIFYCPNCKNVDVLMDYKRRFPRKQCELTATLFYLINGVRNETTVIIKNISLHGYKLYFIDTDVLKYIPPNTACKIRYTLPNKQKSQIDEIIKIVHFIPNEFCCGSAVHDPVDYSFNIRQKGFWLMDLTLDGKEPK